MTKLTQKKTALFILWQAHQEDPEQYLPVWKFIGEIFVPVLNEWFFMSYKGPANGMAIYHENPGMLERRITIGKSGAKYYEYRLAPGADISTIKGDDIREFATLLLAESKGEITTI